MPDPALAAWQAQPASRFPNSRGQAAAAISAILPCLLAISPALSFLFLVMCGVVDWFEMKQVVSKVSEETGKLQF